MDKREQERAAAERPVREAGGGEAEGFEQAEEELVENAAHGDGGADPESDAFPPEQESDRSGVAYGEADGEESVEGEDEA